MQQCLIKGIKKVKGGCPRGSLQWDQTQVHIAPRPDAPKQDAQKLDTPKQDALKQDTWNLRLRGSLRGGI